MLGVIFLLAGVDLENGAKINPDEGSLDVNPFEQTSQILRFGISVSIFILIEVRPACAPPFQPWPMASRTPPERVIGNVEGVSEGSRVVPSNGEVN
jgi:hypothetical protein